MSDEVINEFFYSLRSYYSSHTIEREPTWEDFSPMQAVNYFNNNSGYFSQPTTICQATIIRVGGHKTISPMDIQVC